ncbi:MAG: NAD-dependent epimerase/dehydratase family protein [Alphaproteobacteria bacterium]|nr:NAD-dependent epimerase/dehydratase family protein [Alphaproteobacteria bacterium]MBV8407516.1 NAD-dependent epimerase/dehydratase family protein [Alphaproteobacteria bacterium]
MDLAGKKVLIAGGAGFIGTNLALAVAQRGAQLRLTIHDKSLQAHFPDAETLTADLRQPEDCARAVQGMDCVFLCAAHTSGAAVIRTSPLVHITPNVLINTLMLEAAHRAGVTRFCFISSGAAYPPTADRPVREEEMFDGDPADVYFAAGWMKRYAEVLCRTYAEKITSPMPTVVVRPSNVYGPYDKFDFAVSHVTAALIRRVVERHSPLEVWGTGNDVRDLIYVDDFTEGVLAALAADRPFLAANICAGTGHTVRQILETILRVDGYRDADVRYDPRRPSTIPVRLMDNSFARTELGFTARTSLEDGLRRTIEWYRRQNGPRNRL